MAWGTQGEKSFEDVERLDLSNFILFRQWERRSAPGRPDTPLVAIAAMALLLIVVVGVWEVGEQPNRAIAIFALGATVIGYVTLYRRSLRFNSLIIAKEFVVWETQCSQTWKHLRRSFRFRDLDLPFRLKNSTLLIPVGEITDWSIERNEQADGTETLTVRIVLWRGSLALRTFFVPSRDRAINLEMAIRAAIERMNSGEVGSQQTVALHPFA